MELEKYLENLGRDDSPSENVDLSRLSGLTTEELNVFKSGWAGIPGGHKEVVLSRLIELSEHDIELDFSAVFRDCLEDANELVRERAARGLEDCEDRRSIRPLIRVLTDDPVSKVRTAAAMSLRKFAELAQNGKILSKDRDRLQTALLSVIERTGEDAEVRRRSIEAVAFLDGPEVERIIGEAHSSNDQRLMQSAIYAMGMTYSSRWLPTVLDDMLDERPAIRYEAAGACGNLGDESTAPHLIRLLDDEDSEVQIAAVLALGAIGGPLAKRVLRGCLQQDDEALEAAAQTALDAIEFDEDPLGLRFQV